MKSNVILALYIGESFAEAHLSKSQKSLSFHRWYLGKESLKSGLTKFMQESGATEIDQAVVASRFPEKIFSLRLGGSVAVLTTQGFETWPGARQPSSSKVSALSSTELLFGVPERTTAQGEIEKEPSDQEISELIDSLKQKQAKRVCIHFLNAYKNPANQNKFKEALLKENFEVFIPEHSSECEDEAAQWRKNILNASLSGTFEEIQEEINSALKTYLPAEQRASFISGDGSLFDKENHHRLNSLWGASHTWARNLKRSEKFDILYLGLENFALLHPDKKHRTWNSPWGQVSNNCVQNHLLALQPTTAIELTSWNEFGFSKNALGFEPGPMFLGRGQQPTLLDLWSPETSDIKGLGDRHSAAGLQKFKNQIMALNKATVQPMDNDVKAIDALKKMAMQKMGAEILLQSEHKKILCLGALASIFGNEIKKLLPHLDVEILPETETSFLLSQGH